MLDTLALVSNQGELKTVTDVDLAWLAGIVDGEGSLCHHYDKHTKAFFPSFSLGNTSVPMMERAKAIIDTVCGASYMVKGPHFGKGATMAFWQIAFRRKSSLVRLLMALMPHLTAKKEAAKAMLWEIRCRPNTKREIASLVESFGETLRSQLSGYDNAEPSQLFLPAKLEGVETRPEIMATSALAQKVRHSPSLRETVRSEN